MFASYSHVLIIYDAFLNIFSVYYSYIQILKSPVLLVYMTVLHIKHACLCLTIIKLRGDIEQNSCYNHCNVFIFTLQTFIRPVVQENTAHVAAARQNKV